MSRRVHEGPPGDARPVPQRFPPALALYQRVRGVYVPVLEKAEWPPLEQWLPAVQLLATRTEQALREYGARHAGAVEK